MKRLLTLLLFLIQFLQNFQLLFSIDTLKFPLSLELAILWVFWVIWWKHLLV